MPRASAAPEWLRPKRSSVWRMWMRSASASADLARQRRRGAELEPGRHVRRAGRRAPRCRCGPGWRRARWRFPARARCRATGSAAGARWSAGARRSCAAELARRAREEVLGQRGNVLAAVAQGRQHDLDDVEAIEEILAKAPLADQRREVAVGGRDHAHVDDRGLGRARAAGPRRSGARGGASPGARAASRRSRPGTACRRRLPRRDRAC